MKRSTFKRLQKAREVNYSVKISDAAYILMRENGVTITDLTGTGKDGQITVSDVKKHLKNKASK